MDSSCSLTSRRTIFNSISKSVRLPTVRHWRSLNLAACDRSLRTVIAAWPSFINEWAMAERRGNT